MSIIKSDALLPVLCCLMAATIWGVFWYPLRVLEGMGMPGLWSSLIIYVSALTPALPVLWTARQGMAKQGGLLVLIGLFSGWTNLAFILAILDGTVVRVLLLFYLSPVWAILLARFLLQEHLSPRAWMSLSMAMTGAVFILWSDEIGILMPVDRVDLLAISSGFAFALANIVIRKADQVPIIQKMVSAWAGVICLSLVCIVIVYPALPVFSPGAWSLAIITGLIGMVTMTWLTQYAVTHLPVHRSAILFEFEVVAGALSAALLANEQVLPREWVGGGFILLAAWLIARDNTPNCTVKYDS